MSQSALTTDASTKVSESRSLSNAVIESVAEAEGVDATEIDPLFHAIDPDQLDALFQPQLRGSDAPDAAASIRFTYHGYEVHASATGHVSLTEQ